MTDSAQMNQDTKPLDTIPAGTRVRIVTIDAGCGLKNRLAAMGLLTNEDAMGARMMISMFSVPGEGEDVLTSTVTVTEDGQVLANGQRIR